MYEINLNLKYNKNYKIKIGFNILNYKINNLFKIIKNKNINVIIITNNVLKQIHLKYLNNNIKKIFKNIDNIILPDGERSKSIISINDIYTYLVYKEYNRNTLLISFGGGVIGDLSGFIASTYQRGIKIIHIPTTLLSQVDSSIGGKTAINHPLGKNMIGTFYQPNLVITDTYFLKTLPNKEFISGLSEVIKYGIIVDYDFFVWLENNIDKILNFNIDSINYCIYKCSILKSNIIVNDEKETKNIRYLLNLGHTYGHSIEAFMGYGNWSHGESISAGIIMSVNLSLITNNISIENAFRIKKIFNKIKLPTKGPSIMKPEDYIFYMKKDKKNNNKNINIIIPTNLGKSKILLNVDENIIVKSILNTNNNVFI